ncbi:MAG TPA: hypothetical protein G4O02_00500 [Caldilineae bacterium]|nr:hypothetical protein [Caldilineae bacterium]
MPIEAPVRCRAETRYPERPTEVYWEGVWHPVSLLRSWREPGMICFRVRSEAGRWFLLRYDLARDRWEVSVGD